MFFGCENGKFFFINTFCSEMSRNVFQTWFAVIFIIPAHQNGKNGIFIDFQLILVIFSGYPKMANLEVLVSPNFKFLAKIGFSGSKTIFEMLWVSRNLLVKTPSKIEKKKFHVFNYGIFGHICSDLTSYHNKHPLKWNLAHNEAVGAVPVHLELSGEGSGHAKLGHFWTKTSPKQPKCLEMYGKSNGIFWIHFLAAYQHTSQ